MKKHVVILITSIVLVGIESYSQEALFGGANIVSPEIHSDQTVTFRFTSATADSVQVTGDFLPTVKVNTPMGEMDGPGKAALTKGDDGIWTYTTDELAPELYNYSFIVDGMTTTDPNNPFVIRDVASLTNIFIVGEGQASLYRVNDIPHGTVAKRWYESPGLKMDRRLTIYTPQVMRNPTKSFPYFIFYMVQVETKRHGWIWVVRPRLWII